MPIEKPRLIVRKDERNPRETREGGFNADLSHSRIGSPVRTMQMFYRTIPPGHYSGNHRHNNEAIIYIISGHGFSIVDGERVDWGEGDVMTIPPWAWHNNCNLSAEEPVEFLAALNRPMLEILKAWRIEDEDPKYAELSEKWMAEQFDA